MIRSLYVLLPLSLLLFPGLAPIRDAHSSPSPSPSPVARVKQIAPTERPVLPSAPSNGTPRQGNSTPAAVRQVLTCSETDQPLTALFANNGKDFTRSEYPTLWFYIPYSPDQISGMEFLLLDETETRTIFSTQVQSEDIPGILSVRIPENPSYAMSLGKNYRWYLMLDCDPDGSIEPDLVVDGWIQRKPIDHPEDELWYDAIDTLISRYRSNLNDPTLADGWSQILDSLGYGWIRDEPIVDAVLVEFQ